MQDENLPGVVVGVWVPGEGEYVVAKGEANLDTGSEREPNDPFRIASISKTFTATAILQLVDEGKLSKSDKLSKWYPDFPNADQITVDDLLRMRSGIADSWDQEFVEKYYDDPLLNLSAGDMIERAASKADEFEPPDQETKYTNVNYTILAEIVEEVSGNDFSTQLELGIFEPLGMENTIHPTNSELPGDLHGYGWNPESEEFEDKTILNPAPTKGTGELISDISDLRIYAEALYTGSLLEPQTQEARLATQPAETQHTVDIASALEGHGFEGYGEGIMQWGEFWGHKGDIFGFSSVMFYLPEKDASIIVSVNRLDKDLVQNAADDVFFPVTKILFPEYVDW